MMRVLVTGSDGYIGVVLSSTLREQGHDVVGLDAGFYRGPYLYDDGLKPVTTMRKDVRAVAEEELRGFDAVVHLAELSNDPLGQMDPRVTYDINFLGSTELARKCKTAGVARFVYSSSCSVYGVGADEYQTEDSEPRPQTAYAKCKVLVERQVSLLADEGFSPTFLRNATAYGLSPRMRFDLVLNNLSGLAWTTGEIRMMSDGSPHRPLVHVRDICEAIARTLEAPRAAVSTQILNVGDTNANYRIRDIAEIVAGAFPGCRIVQGPPAGDHRSYRVSFEKIRAVLPGFRCRRTAAVGAQELREVFETLRMTEDLFKSRAFTRLEQLKYLRESCLLDRDLYWTSRAEARTGQQS